MILKKLFSQVNVFFILIFTQITIAIPLQNWRFETNKHLNSLNLISSSPSNLFWDDIHYNDSLKPNFWESKLKDSNNYWKLEPAFRIGTQNSHFDYSKDYMFQGHLLSDIRYKNLTIRHVLNTDSRFSDDSLYPAHRDRFALGRLEDAYGQFTWKHGFFRIGRLNRNWGPFIDRSLYLSDNPYTYDAFEWQIYSSFFEFRHLLTLFPYSGSIPQSVYNIDGVNTGRYFIAHTLNVMPSKYFTVGIFESILIPRPQGIPDIQYINPFSSYTVLNTNKEGSGNLMLGAHAIIYPGTKNVSFKIQGVIDDIQVDKKVEGDKEPNHWGTDMELTWYNPIKLNEINHSVTLGYQKRSSWLYTIPDANYTTGERYTYLGKSLGLPDNDGDKYWLKYALLYQSYGTLSFETAYNRKGIKNLLTKWDDSQGEIPGVPKDYKNQTFPFHTKENPLEKTFEMKIDLSGYFLNYADVNLSVNNRWIKNENNISSSYKYKPQIAFSLGIHYDKLCILFPSEK